MIKNIQKVTGFLGTTGTPVPVSDKEIDKILGIKKGCTKDEVILSAKKLQLKIHPDVGNPNSEYLSKLVNSSKDLILRLEVDPIPVGCVEGIPPTFALFKVAPSALTTLNIPPYCR